MLVSGNFEKESNGQKLKLLFFFKATRYYYHSYNMKNGQTRSQLLLSDHQERKITNNKNVRFKENNIVISYNLLSDSSSSFTFKICYLK